METLIKAFDREDKLDPQNIYLFICHHEAVIDPCEAIRNAFQEWFDSTPEGKEFVADNGCNWGDAVSIPDEILVRHGISLFDSVESEVSFNNEIVVDHNEEFVSV